MMSHFLGEEGGGRGKERGSPKRKAPDCFPSSAKEGEVGKKKKKDDVLVNKSANTSGTEEARRGVSPARLFGLTQRK